MSWGTIKENFKVLVTRAQNYNPPLELRKTLVKVVNFSFQKMHINPTEIKLTGFMI